MTYVILVGEDLQTGLAGVDLVDPKGKEYSVEEAFKKTKIVQKGLKVKYANFGNEYLVRFPSLELAKIVAKQFNGVVARLDIDHLV